MYLLVSPISLALGHNPGVCRQGEPGSPVLVCQLISRLGGSIPGILPLQAPLPTSATPGPGASRLINTFTRDKREEDLPLGLEIY